MKHSPKGSLFGAILLISGCCIGAGMIGLPLVTGACGFIPSTVLFFASWLFMAVTGLLLLEVNLAYSGTENLITLATNTLGRWGKVAAWVLFTYLFYSLMCAYVSASGHLVSMFFYHHFGFDIATSLSSFALIVFFLFFLYAGTRPVDWINRVLMAGLVITYFLLVNLGLGEMNIQNLFFSDWSLSLFAIPVMVISFGYHNLIPSLVSYLGRDKGRLQKAIVIGSFIPLVVYLIWNGVILGLLPIDGSIEKAIGSGALVTDLIRGATEKKWIPDVLDAFSFFAIVTSFLSVALSFIDFLGDGLKVKKTPTGKGILCLLSVIPPFLFSVAYPNIFIEALGFAGAYGAVVLYGIMPAFMVWKMRYHKNVLLEPIVPFGKGALLLVILFSLTVIVVQTCNLWRGA
jgi:tyrosine-specific transport protein